MRKPNRVTGASRKKQRKPQSRILKPRKKADLKRGRTRTAEKRVNIMIVRSSGRKEKFDADRMAQTIGRSGTPYLMARDIAGQVSRKVKASSLKRRKSRQRITEVEGQSIRKMVTQELRKRNRGDIAASYAGERPANSRQNRYSLMNENEPVLDNVAANRSRLLFDGTSRLVKSTKAKSR